MSELERIQAKVTQLYYSHLKKYRNIEENLHLSLPHIPLISEAYLENRIIIMGQETNTWYREGDNDLLNVYLKKYDEKNPDPLYGTEPYRKFISESVEAYPGKFWEFAKNLYSKNLIEGPIQKNGYLGHCWINLFSVEALEGKKDSDGRPTKNTDLRDKVLALQDGLLYELLSILKPKILIALIGGNLSSAFMVDSMGLNWKNDQLKWSTIDPNQIMGDHELVEYQVNLTNHPLDGVKILRTYHPSYFMGRINGNKKLKKKMEDEAIDYSISEYYQKLIFEWISKNIEATS